MSDAADPRLLWHGAITSFADLSATLTEPQWQTASPCPGWSVGDLVAHTIDIEEMLSGTARTDHEPDWAALPHVDRDLARRTEPGVDRRRAMDREAVVDELSATILQRAPLVGALDLDGTMLSPFGREVPVRFMLRMRVFDIWVHEQDIRAVIGEPGNLASPAARASLDLILDSMPKAWAKSAAAPAGSTLRVAVTGAVARTVLVRVDDSGAGVLVDDDPAITPDVQVSADWPTFLGAATGRAPATTVTATGDTALIAAFLPHLNIAP